MDANLSQWAHTQSSPPVVDALVAHSSRKATRVGRRLHGHLALRHLGVARAPKTLGMPIVRRLAIDYCAPSAGLASTLAHHAAALTDALREAEGRRKEEVYW